MKKEEVILSIMTVFVLLTLCTMPSRGLESKITRLHILANSDSPVDQWLKIRVRDAIIQSTDILEGGYSKDRINADLLEEIENIACFTVKSSGFDYDVTAYFTNMYFDTRVYDGFAIPAGYYDAVRVEIGEGKGKNWWCVLFPPLCAPLAGKTIEEISLEAGLTKNDIGIIMKDGDVYALRFKAAEMLGNFRHLFDN